MSNGDDMCGPSIRGTAWDGNRQILEEASAWFIEFRVGGLDRTTRRRFMRWLRRSPDHIRAYMEISGTYARLPAIESASASEVERLIERAKSRTNIVTLDGEGATTERSTRFNYMGLDRDAPKWYHSRPRGLLAAIVAGVCAGAALWMWLALGHSPSYETQTGEQRIITLDDGSRVELNARSKIRVIFAAAQREVELQQGQALFQVAKDPRRPFYVRSGGALVRALGTQFDVYRKESGTTVTVLEGRVVVQSRFQAAVNGELSSTHSAHDSQLSIASPRALELSAGEQAVITVSAIAKPPRANIAAATAWTQGQLEFDETPLPEVAAEFNRYNKRTLVIDSPSLATFRINGVYASTDTASFILFLRSQPDVTVTETDTEVRITQK